ncbi:MAG: polysaccharide biosynthesis protein [bacterium]
MWAFKLLNNSKSFNQVMLQYRQIVIIIVQIMLVLLGYVLAFLLRFDFSIPREEQTVLLQTILFLLACRLATYCIFKLHTGWWQFVSMLDLVNITKAIIVGSVMFLAGLVFIFGLSGYPRSVIIIEAILNFLFLGGIRFAVRWVRESTSEAAPKHLKYILVVGAGKSGSQLLSEIRTNSQLGIQVVGFVDDDPLKQNAYIQGVKVLGNCEQIPELVKQFNVDEIIITIPCAGVKKIAEIDKKGKECGVKVRVLPSISELIFKDGLWQQLRDVPCDELMDRPLLEFRRKSDIDLLRHEIEAKNVMVTGAGGSIGSEIARQCASRNPNLLILYERHETTLYYLERELREDYPDCRISLVVGDILNKRKFNNVVASNDVDLIYHAAAYKHVPMMEREPLEAVRNNIIATKYVVEAAIKFNVEKCVYISTDKAVNPSNIMGTTKRVGEMILQAFSGNETKFITVRFGNVIGSNGSVIPVFKKQICRGGPVTVTHPQVTRYFMTISEAVQLVMTAGAIGKGGEIFLLDMGEPVKIVDMAKKLIRSSGLIPGKDIEIKYTGLRLGEKLHEDLYWKGENIIPTENKKITMLQANGLDRELLLVNVARLAKIDPESSNDCVLEILKKLVPECTLKGPVKVVDDYLPGPPGVVYSLKKDKLVSK